MCLCNSNTGAADSSKTAAAPPLSCGCGTARSGCDAAVEYAGVRSAATSAAPNASLAVPAETAPSAIAYGNRTQVAYPHDALRNRAQGTVVQRVLVGADGAVLGVEIETSSGSRSLGRAAREAVEKWSFHPATRNGVTRSAWALVPATFNLQQL